MQKSPKSPPTTGTADRDTPGPNGLPPPKRALVFTGSDEATEGDIASMIAAQRRLLEKWAVDDGGRCEDHAAMDASLRHLEQELLKRIRQRAGADTLADADNLVDVTQFHVPGSHRPGRLGGTVTLAKSTAMKGLRPFHVELLRTQRTFNMDLVSALRHIKTDRAGVTERELKKTAAGLAASADLREWRLQSHRKGPLAKLVKATKTQYLKALEPFLRTALETQSAWNAELVRLVSIAHTWSEVPKREARQWLEALNAKSDPVEIWRGDGPARFSEPVWREVFRRQTQFNRQIVLVLAELLGVPPPAAPRDRDEYGRWCRVQELAQIRASMEEAAALDDRPLLSVVIPAYNTPTPILRACIDSVLAQGYRNFEICIADDASPSPNVEKVLASYAAADRRVRRIRLPSNQGIAGATNAALGLAKGDFVCFLDHDDTLAPHALGEVALRLAEKPATDVLYSDEDHLDPSGVRTAPFFKPDWSPDLIRCVNYACHFLVVRRELLNAVGNLRSGFDGAQDYDLILRLSEKTQRIEHIARVLYHWRMTPESTATNVANKPAATVAGKKALAEHLQRVGVRGAEVTDPVPTNYRVQYPLEREPLVSIMVPFKDKPALLKTLVTSLLKLTAYKNFELLLVSNNSVLPETSALLESFDDPRIRKLTWNEPFNYSAVNNFAATQARGDIYCFLNNDIEIVDPNWLRELVSQAQRPEIGAVGPKLLFPVGTLQHAGVILGLQGFAGHAFAGMNDNQTFTAFGSSDWPRNYLAVTSACVVMRKDVFDAIHGYDETFVVCGSDVDLCLRIVDRGLRVLYTPYTRLIHDESSTRKTDSIPEGDFWRSFASYRPYLQAGDPFYNPNLSLGVADGTLSTDDRTGEELSVQLLATALPSSRITPLQKSRIQSQRHMAGHLHNIDYSSSQAERARLENKSGIEALRRKGRLDSVTWFLPFFHHPYGGVHTILRFGEMLRARHGVNSSYIVYDNPHASVRELEARVLPLFPSIKGSIRVIRGGDEIESLPATDLAVATLWTSAFAVIRHPKATARGYFIQDYEPLFYSAGTYFGLAEQTYRLNLHGIFNTEGLHDFVTSHYPMEGVWFEPSVDLSVFHAKRPPRAPGPARVFFYGRPSTDRNAFELGISTLCKLKRDLGSKVEIFSAGEAWNPADYGAQGLITNLGVLPYEKTGDLYRSIDVGLAFMFTKHPSYLPLEMMACGVTVVTNDNPANHWLLEHDKNCLLADPTYSCVVEQLKRAVGDAGLRSRIGATATQRMQRTTWEEQVDKVHHSLVTAPSADSKAVKRIESSISDVHRSSPSHAKAPRAGLSS